MGKTSNKFQAKTLYTGDYHALESSFIEEVKSVKKRDIFSPLIVIVTSKLLGIYLQRLLSVNGVSNFNIRFKTLEDVSNESTFLYISENGYENAPPYGGEVLLRWILKQKSQSGEITYFKDIADLPFLSRAFLSTIRDLKDACLSPEILTRFDKPKFNDLKKIWKEYDDKLKELGWFDGSDLMKIAVQEVKKWQLLKQSLSVFFYGFYDFTEIQKRLVESIMEEKETTFFFLFKDEPSFEYAKPALKWLKKKNFSGEIQVFDKRKNENHPIQKLCRNLFCEKQKSENSIEKNNDKFLKIFSLPGETAEVREIVREIVRLAKEENIPLEEVGILLRSHEKYSLYLKEFLSETGLEPYMQEGFSLSQTKAGMVIGNFIKLMKDDFLRDDVIHLVKLVDSSNPGIHSLQWDLISIAAGIIGGKGYDEWFERLQGLKKIIEDSKNNGEALKERGKSKLIRRINDEEIDSFIEFIKKLSGYFEVIKNSAATWKDKTKALLDALEFAGKNTEGYDKVKETICRLEKLDSSNIPSEFFDFLFVVEEAISENHISEGKFQRNGPAILGFMPARGVGFKVVVIPGMVEKYLPPVFREDAILLDEDRKSINRVMGEDETQPLPLKKERRLEEEKLLFRLAVSSAKEKLIMSFPRVEIGTDKVRMPSSFLLSTLSALTGRHINFFEAKEFLSPGPTFPVYDEKLRAENALNRLEFDTLSFISLWMQADTDKKLQGILYLKEIIPFFEKSLNMEASRWENPDLTIYEGMIRSREALKKLQEKYSICGNPERPVSPTDIETYAKCPFQYFLRRILHLEPIEEPVKKEVISAGERGELVHAILRDFYRNLRKELGGKIILKEVYKSKLYEIMEKNFKEVEDSGGAGYKLLWEFEKSRIKKWLDGLFDDDLKEKKYIPSYFEVSFGRKLAASEQEEIATENPVRIKVGNKDIYFKGRIDRIDITDDGKIARVRDYKTGKPVDGPEKLKNGENIQLPVYLISARELFKSFGRGTKVDFADFYCFQYKKDKFKVLLWEEFQAKLKQSFEKILLQLIDFFDEGFMSALPKGKYGSCVYCDFEGVCGNTMLSSYEEKLSKDSILRGFIEFRESQKEEKEKGKKNDKKQECKRR